MRRFTLLVSGAILAAVCAPPLAAQQPSAVASPKKDTSAVAVRDTLKAPADSAVRELERAVSALAESVQQIVAETANKPEVRIAAVQVAVKAATLAQKTLVENMSEIEKMLAEASRALADLEAEQKAKVAKP